MNWTWQDLVLFSGAVYGLAWLVTASKLFEPLRTRFKAESFFGRLISCIVCTGTWIAGGLFLVSGWSGLFSPGFSTFEPVSLLVLLGWSMFVLWVVGKMTGDAS